MNNALTFLFQAAVLLGAAPSVGCLVQCPACAGLRDYGLTLNALLGSFLACYWMAQHSFWGGRRR